MVLQALRQALWDSPKRRNRSCLFVCNIVYGLVAVMFGTCSMIIIAQRELCTAFPSATNVAVGLFLISILLAIAALSGCYGTYRRDKRCVAIHLFIVLVLVAVQMVLAALMWGATSDESMRYYDAEMRDGWIRLVDQGYIARRADGCVGEASAISSEKCLDICPSKWLRALQEKHDCCAYDDTSSTLQNPTDCGCTADMVCKNALMDRFRANFSVAVSLMYHFAIVQCCVILLLLSTVCRCKSLAPLEGDWDETVEDPEDAKSRGNSEGRTCTGQLANSCGWLFSGCSV